MWQNSTTPNVTKLNKKINFDKTKTHKMWQKSKIWIVTKIKSINCDKTQKLILWEKIKNSNFDKTKKKNSNCNPTQQVWRQKKSWQKLFGIDNSTPKPLKKCFWGSLLQTRNVLQWAWISGEVRSLHKIKTRPGTSK